MAKAQIYEKPWVEVEFNQVTLLKEGCCRLVPCVLRLGEIAENTQIHIALERATTITEEGSCFTYEAHPSIERFAVAAAVSRDGYREYAFALLARPFDKDTGMIMITVSSSSSTLTEVIICLDSREREPIYTLRKGRLKAYRALRRLRSQEERNALNGAYIMSPVTHGKDPGREGAGRTDGASLFG